jgi:hypothetical protein
LNELDEEWSRVLAEAEDRARRAGRADVVEYLNLRASNDLARKTAIEWLFNSFTERVAEANRAGASIRIEKQENHRFPVGNATMVGALLTFRSGVRALMIEAGWPRAPRDGIVRGGGLACARIRHLGRRAANEELLLVHSKKSAPQWFILEETGTRTLVQEAHLNRHLARFMDEA